MNNLLRSEIDCVEKSVDVPDEMNEVTTVIRSLFLRRSVSDACEGTVYFVVAGREPSTIDRREQREMPVK